MNTKLKVKSNILATDEENNKLLKKFVEYTTGKTTQTELVHNDKYVNSVTPIYYIEYDNHYELRKALNAINAHRYTPYAEFKSISIADYDISLESENINESFGHLSEQNIKYLEDQINILGYAIGLEIDERKQMKNRIDSMHAFMDQSGLFYYKSMIEYLINKLDEKNIINKEDLNPNIFKQLH